MSKKKFLKILYQPYKWLIFAPYLALSTLFFGSLAVIASFINPKFASLIAGVTWAKLNGYVTPMFVKVHGRENIDKSQSYIVVSNHLSHYDIFVLYGWLGIDFKWVMKQELRRVPFLGIACEKVGHIFIDRSNSQLAIESINSAKKKIVNGTSVIFFPEGTRSKDGKIGDFKKGAFRFALDLNLPILPVTIKGTNNILPSNTIDLFPGKAELHIHKPFDITGFDNRNMQDLMNNIKEIIKTKLD